ncbi:MULTISPECIES: type III sulfide quinone reductase, selenoprotein subtype [unclassified Nocardioides]|uniref:type III sulfide quinone reductase, selenoprotein subtype n=1 Tax=unclassified Nocardioides TaxID=2615069 RepID=UPI0009EFE748|nr:MULTISPECIES: FAD/NAD(P)-binding oxidoreductase [unclassified Nocardioides]GAW50893.1 FAD-dependent pyridine nucleotide-disulfide oxidoreductase [Nocardioides sp. PD653-B2]GAW54051.1 FAD-dependent pyridine nucleotide-disulfide oxidoreductase [Nocardioides sp. PD653]
MHELLVLGGGTAGTMVANKLRRRLEPDLWCITVVDQDDEHHYQPGYLQVPFGTADPADVTRSRHAQIADGVRFVTGTIDVVDAERREVRLTDGTVLAYEQLVIATGTSPRPDATPGLTGELWQHSIHEFYTLAGATRLREALGRFGRGRLVVHITEMPIKCPVAPLEFTFLAEAWFRGRGQRDAVEITYVTPLSGAFTRPIAAERLGHLLDERKIHVETDFVVEHVDDELSALVSYDGRTIPFDLLVTVPLNMGADFVARSGLGDDLNYVPVDPETFLARGHDDIFAIGDASDIPTSKAGSVAHFAVDVFVDNFLEHIAGRPMTHAFDGHANCFVESGDGKALLIDFNYEVEPLPGRFPLPFLGPMTLLEETRINHLGKQAFPWIYWNVLLPGRPLPLPAAMSMAGKHAPHPTDPEEE